ncbi:MAG: bifunctional adenosylcobinamide kinase/adenosylcobinamide-phosphate guanylyltransferase [Oscillospiraceae bacterium]|jgi:adenosylcobinamide kinase/adenosylcobinamide-phosphate guanylyltransferase
MSKIFLVTGGVKSGKTMCAVKYFEECDNVVYIATLDNISEGTEIQVNENKFLRPESWITREEYFSPARAIGDEKIFILDSITYMVLNIMREIVGGKESITKEDRDKILEKVLYETKLFVDTVHEVKGDAIIITNEIGFSIMPSQQFELVFRDILAKVNTYLGQNVEEIYLSICGIQLRII